MLINICGICHLIKRLKFLSWKGNNMVKTENLYALPFSTDVKTIAISDPKAHYDHFKHAIDFLMGEETPIFAMRDGAVTEVKDDSDEGGLDEKYRDDIKYLNYLTLQHDNGEYSQYCHVKYRGVLVRVGDRVKEGQDIALSGNTGYSSAPHLHVMVFRLNKTKIGWESLEIRWKDYQLTIHTGEEANELLQTEEYKPLLDAIVKPRKNQVIL
jgi:murein DD-endopeptidase MepM/ murein hydrolase activator NlpD